MLASTGTSEAAKHLVAALDADPHDLDALMAASYPKVATVRAAAVALALIAQDSREDGMLRATALR